MKRLLMLFFIVIIVSFFAAPARMEAFSLCRSERKGYCVRLDSSAVSPSTGQSSSRLLADAGAPFPGLEFLQTYGIGFDSDISEILSALYNFGVVIAGISALIMFTYGGMRYLTSAGSSSALSDAKNRMTNAIFGLVLIATSYLIFYTINPELTATLKSKIPSIAGLSQ